MEVVILRGEYVIFANISHAKAVILKNYRSQPNEGKFLHIDVFWQTVSRLYVKNLDCIYGLCFLKFLKDLNVSTIKNCNLPAAI